MRLRIPATLGSKRSALRPAACNARFSMDIGDCRPLLQDLGLEFSFLAQSLGINT